MSRPTKASQFVESLTTTQRLALIELIAGTDELVGQKKATCIRDARALLVGALDRLCKESW
jgi:hypothetical protein